MHIICTYIHAYIHTNIHRYVHMCVRTYIHMYTIYIRTCVVWCDWAVCITWSISCAVIGQCVSCDLCCVLIGQCVSCGLCYVLWLVSMYHVTCVMCCDWSVYIMLHVLCVSRDWCYVLWLVDGTFFGVFNNTFSVNFSVITCTNCDTKMVLRNSWNIYITNVMIMLC